MNLNTWLKHHRISAKAFDAELELQRFLQEMEIGLSGNKSSLLMLPSYISQQHPFTPGKPVGVIDAGGTNLRTCTLTFESDGTPVIEHFQKQPIPGSRGLVTPDEFHRTIVDAMEPYLDSITRIGFCFSYETEIFPDLDGRLLHWSKEIQMPDLVGKKIGKGLLEELRCRNYPDKKIVILNDTIATLLATQSDPSTTPDEAHVGFILGTGMNSAYIENNTQIHKLTEKSHNRAQAINMESGNFSVLERGSFDIEFDQQSDAPGLGVLEKMMSGAYYGDLGLLLFKKAAEDGFFTADFRQFIQTVVNLHIMHLDNYVSENGRDIGPLAEANPTEADRKTLFQITDALTDRAALFSAVNLTAAAIRGSKAKNSSKVCFNIDGSTFHMTKNLKKRTKRYLDKLQHSHKLNCRLIKINDSPILGAAYAAWQSS